MIYTNIGLSMRAVLREDTMEYKEAIDFIHSTYKFGSKLGLTNIKKLTELMDSPQKNYQIIHVAGTNGKGSTSAMIHDVLAAAGYKTGLFISPFLEEFNERIQINRKPIDNQSLAKMTGIVKEKIDIMLKEGYNHPTEFEVVTAIGFEYFAEQKIDFLVLEVGLGGRFDATNVVENTLVSVITSISYDHMQYLGNTLEEIAFEKAGIIKPASKVVVYPQASNITDVIKKQAALKSASLHIVDAQNIKQIESDISGQKFAYLKRDVFDLPNLRLKLLGEHQLYNCATALAALEEVKLSGFSIPQDAIKEGLSRCTFPGRFEIINSEPLIILDGGHNINGIECFAKAIRQYFGSKKINLFYGMLKDKNPDTVIDDLLSVSKKIYTLTPDNPRAMDAEEMASLIRNHDENMEVSPVSSFEDVLSILKSTKKDEVTAFVGSLYLIGGIRTLLRTNGYADNIDG